VRRAIGLLAGLAFLVLGGAGFAASSSKPPPVDDLAAAVPDVPGKTWLDLLREIFPDIAEPKDARAAATASETIDLRSIGSGDESWGNCGDHIEITKLNFQAVRISGQTRLIVVPSFADNCLGLVALFDGDGKIVDAVNLQGDQHISFIDDYVRPLGPEGVLVTGWNWHDNSDQSYDDAELVIAKADGLTSIDGVFAFGSRDCRSQFTESPTIRVVPRSGTMARIEASVRRESKKFAEDCNTQVGKTVTTTFDAYWRWNAAKREYEPHTREFKILDKWNAKRF
jgi:hypothetical protein